MTRQNGHKKKLLDMRKDLAKRERLDISLQGNERFLGFIP
jgi:hypothetical protein